MFSKPTFFTVSLNRRNDDFHLHSQMGLGETLSVKIFYQKL